MAKQGAVPTDARYNGMTGKDVCGGGKMTSGDKGLWTEEHPPTRMSQHISWPRQLAHREQKNESFRGFSFVLSSICIIFAETFWETGDTSALYINYNMYILPVCPWAENDYRQTWMTAAPLTVCNSDWARGWHPPEIRNDWLRTISAMTWIMGQQAQGRSLPP